MILSSWLATVFGRLQAASGRVRARTRRSNPLKSLPRLESLEQRMLLTAPTVTPVTVNFTANSQVFPYAANSIPAGTDVTAVTVSDVDAPPNGYTVGNLVITGGNVDVDGNGQLPFGVATINGQDHIVVNDSRDLYIQSGVTKFTLTVVATDNSATQSSATVITVNLLSPGNTKPVIPQYVPTDRYNYGAIVGLPDGLKNVLQVNENSFQGTIVGTVTAADPDNTPLTYKLIGTVPGFNTNSPAFDIDPFTGKIRVVDPTFLDYEARRNGSGVGNLGEGGLLGFPDVVFDLQVRATDLAGSFSQTTQPGGGVSDSHVYIRLRDVGETPPVVTNSTKSLSVNENSPKGLSLGYFELISGTPNFVVGPPRTSRTNLDPTEPQQTHSFAIVGGNPNNAFAIDYTTGEVTVNNAVLNYEALNVYNLQIAVTDENVAAVSLGAVDNVAPLTTIATLHITVNDINEQTAIPSGQSFSIPENTINGTVVGTVVATDPDTQKPNGQASLVYSIISGNTVKVNGDNYPLSQPNQGVGVFSIDPDSGVITVNNQTLLAQNVALNFENQPSFSLTVQVVDRSDQGTSANATVIINLSNVNETPPSLNDTSFTIAENRSLNTLVGKVTAAVGEIGNTITSYQITAGNTGGAFAIDNSGNITVANPAMINFETNPQYVLTVKATDNGNPALFTTGKVTINITNLNEQIVMLDQSFSLNENTPNGTVIGQIITSDPDNQVSSIQGTQFVINSGNTGGAFAIDDQGRISVNNVGAVNFEVNPSFSLIITVNDTGASAVPTTSTAATFTISLFDVNDAPVVGNQSFNIKEHSLAGTTVGTVAATDADLPAQKLTYAITAGDPTGAFVINPNTGAITVTDPHLIDYDANPNHKFDLTVQITDNGTPSLSSSATVSVFLQSVSAPELTSSSVTIPENTVNGTSVFTVVASGGVSPYTYSIIGGNTNNAFAIAPGSGLITVNDVTQLNYEAVQKFDLKILVTDSQLTPLGDTATITVNLSNVNEAPILSGIEGAALIWNENTVGQYGSNLVTPITDLLAVTDTDTGSQNMSSATVQITGNYIQGEDILSFTPVGNITGSWDATTGKLTLSGLDTQANYTTALRSVSYTDIANAPNTAKRTVAFQVFDDGTDGVNPPGSPLPSNSVTRDIQINPTNDPPSLSGIELTALAWTENTPPSYGTNNVVTTTSTITASDADSLNLSGATVQITGNYQSTEDQLVFSNTATITGVFDSVTGKLTLTGTDTLANYIAALRSVGYTDTSDAPNLSKRTLTYQITDDGALTSNTVTRDINLTAVNDPPTLTGIELSALTWAENTPPNFASNNVVPVSTTIVAGDPDSAILTGAIVQITGNYHSAEDRLVFVSTANIIGTFDPGTGILTLAGTDTLANYTAALQSVSYTNLSDTPNTAKRTVTYVVTDDGALNSTAVSRDIIIAPVNDPPTLTSIEGSALDWIENTPPNFGSNNVTPTTATLVAGDPDGTMLTGATVQITGNFQASEDQLVFTNTGTITGVFDPGTGKLTLTGTDTLANYTAALRSVAYTDTSDTPNTVKRTLTYQVIDDASLASAVVTRDINITAVNDPPVLSSLEPTNLTYVENSSVAVTGTVLVTDPDSNTASSATVQISANYVTGEDTLVFANTANISGVFDPLTGTLTLTGVDTLSNYRAALRSVNYVNLSDNPSTAVRTLTFEIKDDNGLASTPVSRGLTVVPVNDAPVLSAPVQFMNYTEGTGAQIINSTITISDVDSPTLVGATITLTNYQSNEDLLGFVNNGSTMGNITVGSNLGGVLQLTSAGGTATLAQWQAALNAVTYTNTSQNPSTILRTATYVVNDGGPVSNLSNAISTTITVIPVNNAPTLSNPSNVTYIENGAPLSIDPVIGVSDPDNTTFLTGTVTITNFVATEDQISFVNDGLTMGNISVQSNVNGILILVSSGGTATTAQWRAAFAAVTYYNFSDNPSDATRTVTFTLYDGQDTSDVLTSTVAVVPVNDRPVLSGMEGTPLQYLENTAPSFGTNNTVIISQLVAASDPDSVLTGAVIQITGNYVSGQDYLIFKNTAKITGSFDTVSGTLTLSGTDSLANYTAALNSIGYFNRSDNPSTATRTVSFAVIDDGGPSGTPKLTSVAVTRDITVISVNDPPVLIKADQPALAYTENAPPVPVMPNLNVTDADSNNLFGATVQITGNYNANGSQDTLIFVNTAKITGSWDATTGILTLTGSDTLSNYRTALRSVAFANIHDNVTAPPRTITFAVIDNTSVASNLISRDINITTVPDGAILSDVEATSKVYKALDPFTPATPISTAIVVTDYDSLNQISAVIQISNNYVRGQDQLVIDQGVLSANQLTASWNDIAGKLTLTGIAPQANYQNALRAVKYVNSSTTLAALITATRTISFQVVDDTPGTPLSSNFVTRDVSINPNNIVPSLAVGNAGALPYTEKDPPTNIAPNLTITDSDSPNMNGAIIKITGNYQFPEDQLVFTNIGPIKGSWNSSTGTLTLSGLDSQANYQAALQSVKYLNTNNNPSTLKRTVSFLVNDGLATSNTVTRDINVTPVNDPPVIKTNVNLALVYSANSGPVAIAPGLTVTDPDGVTITSARVAVTFNYQRGLDVLSFTNTSKITGIFDTATGVLTLTGADSLSNYRAALQSVAYTFTSTPIGGNKTIAFSAYDGNDTSVTVPGISTRDIVFSNPPVVNPNTLSLSYPTGNVDAAIAPGLTITDPDSALLASAVIQVTAGYVNGTDILSFANTAKIIGSFDPASGKLTLTGLDTVSNYRSALRSVTYKFAGTPGGQPRTISFSAYDGSAVSNVAKVSVIYSSAPPLLNANVTSFRYPTANTSVAIAPQLTVTDPDSNFLASATVKITAGYVNGVDILSFQNTGPISGVFDAATGTLTLTGTDSVSNYRSALRSVQYLFGGTPAGQAKTITFSTSDGIATSNLSKVNIYVSNAPATVSTNAATALEVTSSPVVIANALTVTDPGSDFIQSATVRITNYESGVDSLLFTDTAKINGAFDNVTGILTLTGLDTVGAYREALRTVKYAFTGSPLSPKTISFQVNDGFSDSNIATRDLTFASAT